MKLVLFSNKKEGDLWLSDETPDHHLTLRSKGDPKIPDGDYKPSDILVRLNPPLYAACLVYNWATERRRSEQDIACAREYLSQWPEGPQADPESLKKAKENAAAIKRATAELGTDHPLNKMSDSELRQTLKTMEEKLLDCAPKSALAIVLKLRIGVAKALLRHDS